MDRLHCPKCGCILVRRDAEFGEFVGCGSYPQCDHSAPLSDFTKEELDQIINA